MTNLAGQRPVLQNRLFIEGEEMRETPQTDRANPESAFENTDELVSRLITEEKRRTSPLLLPELAPADDAADKHETCVAKAHKKSKSARKAEKKLAAAERKATKVKREKARLPALKFAFPKIAMPKLRKSAPAVDDQAVQDADLLVESTVKAVSHKPSGLQRLASKLFALTKRIRTKHVVYGALLALVVLRPLMVLLVMLLVFWLILIVYLSVGPDRLQEFVAVNWMRLHARRPEQAERLRKRADRFAERFDRVLDWLPESWAEKLALPDFSDTPRAGPQPDPFDRLASQTRQS